MSAAASPSPALAPTTLVTPLRNERDNIERIWSSIQSQTLKPGEWIIMDNGSTDGTREWLERVVATSPFPVRVLSLPGMTIARMMNRAIAEASHEIISCCHGGTRIPADWLKELLGPFESDASLEAVAGTWEAMGETPFSEWIAGRLRRDAGNLDERRYLPATRSFAFRRSAWKKVNGFPEWLPKFGEDTLFAIRLRASGARFALAPKAKVGWFPKPRPRDFLRQEMYYAEANSIMGYYRPGWREFVRPWALPAALLAALAFSVGAGLSWLASCCLAVATLLLPLADWARLSAKRVARGSLGDFVFWKWVFPIAQHAGWARAHWLRLRLGIRVPAEDQAAIRSYLRKP